MSPQRKDDPEVTIRPEEDDAADPRTFDHESADAVRNGELSAAQLPGGNGNVDPNEPDAQYPPGVVDNVARMDANPDYPDARTFVPDRSRNTSAAPSFDNGAE